jgi:large subunit ribosomal protein L4
MVLNDMSSLNTKTKDVKALMTSLKLENEKVLFILSEKNENAYLGSRNLKKVKVVTADSFNTYDLLNASKIIVSSESIKKIENILN